MTFPPDIGLFAQTACIWEVCARKPGNVNRLQDFPDAGLTDFLLSAVALGPLMEAASHGPVGLTVFEAIRIRRDITATNTNLGIVLLLAPLAKAAACRDFRPAVGRVLENLDGEGSDDAELLFAAIRLANAGGLGKVPEQDIQDTPTIPIREAMALAAERDLVARQYVNGFKEVFEDGVPAFLEGFRLTGSVEEAIILCQLRLMAQHPDSLIARKRGRAEAEEASRRAVEVLAAGWPVLATSWARLREFDAWLRAEGHSRNPGTTADLVTASLFVALVERSVSVSSRFPWRAAPTEAHSSP
jgi:triphosphoribosyl-dephospho-CoA synthase